MTRASHPSGSRIAVAFLAAAVGILWLPGCEDEPLAPWLEAPPEFITAFGGFGSQDGGLYFPSGICVDQEGNILVTDTIYPRVQVFAPDGMFLRSVGLEGQTTPSYLAGIEVASDGTIFVSSRVRGLLRFDAEGKLLGRLGPAEDFGLARDRSGEIWASRTWSEEIEPRRYRIHPFIVRLAPDGTVADSVALPTYTTGDTSGGAWSPGNLAVDPQGNFYSADRDVIRVVTRDGQLLERPFYSSPERDDGSRRQFEDIAVDAGGFVYVVDYVLDQILKIDPQGRLACVWGREIPDQNPMKAPLGSCIDAVGDVYVTDSWNHRVLKFGYRDR